MRRWVRIGVLVLLLAATSGCAESGLGLGEPRCVGGGSAIVLELQAVPSAELVPCYDELEPGWELAEFVARNGSARFVLDSDRDGPRFLEVEVSESCDVSEATPVPAGRDPRLPLASDRNGVERFVAVEEAIPSKVGEAGYYRGSWFFRFDGGCVTYRFDASGSTVETVPDEVAEAMGWISRRIYADILHADYGADYYTGGDG
jgi:hypothetical protein